MSRITLAGALGIVGILAVGLAAIRIASAEGERLVFTLTLALHTSALVGTLLRGFRSPGWLGFSVLGWTAFLAVTADLFSGPAGSRFLVTSDVAQASFDVLVAVPSFPVVDGVRLESEPDKMTASDRAIQAYQGYEAQVSLRDDRRTRVGTIADLLGSILAAMAGAGVGLLLAPRAPPVAEPGSSPLPPS
jgi:hypothetical protein